MEKSIVSIVKGTDAEKLVDEALSLLGGVSALIKPNSTVIIKPNAGHAFPEDWSVNTNPVVVAAVIKAVRKAQPKEIILAEAAANGCDTLECLEVSGIRKAAEEAGVDRIVDIKREKDLITVPIRDAKSDMTKVLLPRFLIEAEHLINIPIFKSHCAMVFTCALKNIKGVVQDKVHHQMHRTNLAMAMMDLWSVCKADLTIADMIRPAEGFGPHGAVPTDFGCIVAGKDPVAVDATACRMVGLDIKKVTYFEAAAERGIGNFSESAIEIRGKTIKEVFKQLWLPYLRGLKRWPEYNFVTEGACSSCEGLIAAAMERLKAMGEYDKNAGITIVAGPKREIPKRILPKDLILFGDCTKKWRDQGVFISGCPPFDGVPPICISKRISGEEALAAYRKKLEEEGAAGEEYYRTMERSIADQKSFLEYAMKVRDAEMARTNKKLRAKKINNERLVK